MNSLDIIKNAVKKNCPLVDLEEQFEDVEEQLKVLEILKNKKVNIWSIENCINAKEYSSFRLEDRKLTAEEFKILKRWLDK